MIRVLPDIVQNKIAAGEVVERPASAVKELVENAIDAGAGRINIEIEDGGMRTIRVADDGCGMSGDDLLLSVMRHATSKIRDVEDIFAISTMGFRGEALPSIGSVSRLTISTCTAGESTGSTLKVVGGKSEGVLPAPPRKGTIVEVQDLFFNTPARRKFMKSSAAEMGAVNETITRIALANPGVAFTVKGNGKKSMELVARDGLQDRIKDLFGKSLELLPVEYTSSNGELRVSGYCARPPESRGNSKFIYTLLNNRWIKHPGIIRGIIDSYQGNLPPRRYPFAVICFDIDPAKVDVNAHPTKEVVRFENDSLFVGSSRKAIEAALKGGEFSQEVERARLGRENITDNVRKSVEGYVQNGSRDALKFSDSHQPGLKSYSPVKDYNFRAKALEGSIRDFDFTRNDSDKESVNAVGKVVIESRRAVDENEYLIDNSAVQEELEVSEVSKYKFIGQAGGKYIIAETDNGVVFIDQHALHERWNYNRLSSKEYNIDSQRLLIPVEIELSAVEEALISESLPILEEAGFDMKLDGAMLSVLAHPDILKPHNIERIVRDVMADLDSSAVEEYRNRINASLACRSAVLFGTNLSDELCRDLLDKLGSGALFTCPHGRPTTITFTWKELAYKFER